MATNNNTMHLWSTASTETLLDGYPAVEMRPGNFYFALGERDLQGVAVPGGTDRRRSDADIVITIDFDRAASLEPAHPAGPQADFFARLLGHPEVDAAVLAHQGLWVLACRIEGRIHVTNRPVAANAHLTVALCASLDELGLAYDRGNLGTPGVPLIPLTQPASADETRVPAPS